MQASLARGLVSERDIAKVFGVESAGADISYNVPDLNEFNHEQCPLQFILWNTFKPN